MSKGPIENKIYKSIIGICEEKEHEGIYRGNGHHFAQQLTKLVSISLLPPEKQKIYLVLSKDEYLSTAEVSTKVGMSSKNTSSLLIQLYNTTNLISCINKGKLKYWVKK